MPNEPLKPKDFPIAAEDKKLKKQDGKTVAETTSQPLAEDTANRLNEDEDRKEQDRWAL